MCCRFGVKCAALSRITSDRWHGEGIAPWGGAERPQGWHTNSNSAKLAQSLTQLTPLILSKRCSKLFWHLLASFVINRSNCNTIHHAGIHTCWSVLWIVYITLASLRFPRLFYSPIAPIALSNLFWSDCCWFSKHPSKIQYVNFCVWATSYSDTMTIDQQHTDLHKWVSRCLFQMKNLAWSITMMNAITASRSLGLIWFWPRWLFVYPSPFDMLSAVCGSLNFIRTWSFYSHWLLFVYL